MKKYLPIAGTFTRSDRRRLRNPDEILWCQRGSTFDKRARYADIERVEQDRDPTKPDKGFWKGELEGLLAQSLRDRIYAYFGWETVDNWQMAADLLRLLLIERWEEWLQAHTIIVIVAHSHGGQIATIALADLFDEKGFPTPFNHIELVTVDMPVRPTDRMYEAYAKARQQVHGRWTHLYSSALNPTRMIGARGIGPCKCPFASVNLKIKGGHSGALVDPRYIGQVIEML